MYDAKVVDDFARRLNEKVRYLRTHDHDLVKPTRTFADAVLHDLEQIAEELRVTGEELRAQSDQLLLASRAIDQERERFFRLFDLAPDPIIVTDLHGVILEMNRAAARLLGWDRTLMERKPLPGFLSADSTRDFRAAIHKLRRMEAVKDLALNLTPRTGLEVPTTVRATHLSAANGEGERILWTFRDRSDLLSLDAVRRDLAREKEGREVAEARSEQARYLVRAAAELVADADRQRVASRAARLAADFGDYATIELFEPSSGLTVAGVFHHDLPHHAFLMSRLGGRICSADTHELAHYLRSSDGTFVGPTEPVPALLELDASALTPGLRPIAVSLAPLSVQGEPIGLLRVAATTPAGTEQLLAWAPLLQAFASYVALSVYNARLLQEADARRSAAEESSRGRTRAMAGLSHELRTPLHSILGYSELMLDGVAGELEKKALQYVTAIRASALHQAELVDDILALARPGRPARLSAAEVPVEEVVQECVGMVVERARANGVEVRVDVSDQATLVTDRSKLSQVLINLLNNAVKFTSDGEVSITVRDDGSYFTFDVRDTGCGIAASELPHVFEPFWQGTASEKRGGEGSGLGLSLVERLVTVLGGSVAVHSQERVGTTFRVRLPRTLTSA